MKATMNYLTLLLSGALLITSCTQHAGHWGVGEGDGDTESTDSGINTSQQPAIVCDNNLQDPERQAAALDEYISKIQANVEYIEIAANGFVGGTKKQIEEHIKKVEQFSEQVANSRHTHSKKRRSVLKNFQNWLKVARQQQIEIENIKIKKDAALVQARLSLDAFLEKRNLLVLLNLGDEDSKNLIRSLQALKGDTKFTQIFALLPVLELATSEVKTTLKKAHDAAITALKEKLGGIIIKGDRFGERVAFVSQK